MFYYLLIITLLTFMYYLYRYMCLRINRAVPTIPNAISFTEMVVHGMNLKELLNRIIYIGEYTNKNGGVSKFITGTIVTYVITTPEDAFTVLTRCMDKMFLYSMVEQIFGKVLFAAPVHVWKRNRRFLDVSFKPKILDDYIDTYHQQAKVLVSSMSSKVNTEIDFHDVIVRNILEIVCKTMIGANNEEITEEYINSTVRMLDIFIERFKRPWLLIDFIFYWSTLKKEQDNAFKIVRSLSEKMIKLRRSEFANRQNITKDNIEVKGTTFKSCLEVLIENMEGEVLSDLDLKQLMNNVVIAGLDTTVPQIIISLICIGSFPEVQRKLYDEITNVTSKDERSILKEDLLKMTYLDAVLKETLRVYPIAPIVARNTNEEVTLNNHVIPADCPVMVHLWAINRNKLYWGSDADEFRPERWLDGSVPSHPAAFASFSPGRRNCIGDPGVYKVDCGCGVSYIGQIKRSIKEHISDMKNKRTSISAVYEHAKGKPNCNCINFNNPKILAKEYLHIQRILRDAIKKHQNFNREDGWQIPPLYDHVIKIVKSQTKTNTESQKDTVSSYCCAKRNDT